MGKVILAGTGRAGTSLIMQILTEMHYDTGMHSQSYGWNENIRAGMELPLPFEVSINEKYDYELKTSPGMAKKMLDEMPKILKSPDFSSILKCLIENKVIEIEHIIIPMRDVNKVAESRIKVGLDLKRPWQTWGVAEEGREKKQKIVLYGMLDRLFEVVFLYDIPYTVIKYPDMVYKLDYLLEKLKQIFPELDEKEFWRVCHNVVRPDLVTIK